MKQNQSEHSAAEAERRVVPEDDTLECLAQLPEEIRKMALGYGYGLLAGRKISIDQTTQPA